MLWNDTRSAAAARDLIRELGGGDEAAGRAAWAGAVGSVPVASLTVTKLRRRTYTFQFRGGYGKLLAFGGV